MDYSKVKEAVKSIKPKEKMFGGNKFEYPKDHKLGMEVPEEGSHCANCKYLSEDHKHCTNKVFIKWLGDDKLPKKDEKYCCDLWNYGKKK